MGSLAAPLAKDFWRIGKEAGTSVPEIRALFYDLACEVALEKRWPARVPGLRRREWVFSDIQP